MRYPFQGSPRETHRSHIHLDERRKITWWRMAGIGVEILAENLGRYRSTIFREIRRYTFADQ